MKQYINDGQLTFATRIDVNKNPDVELPVRLTSVEPPPICTVFTVVDELLYRVVVYPLATDRLDTCVKP